MCLGDAITTLDRLFLVSIKKAEELLPKWGDRAEFFSRRDVLKDTSNNVLFEVKVQRKTICRLFQIMHAIGLFFYFLWVYVFHYRLMNLETVVCHF